jgi:hypothetical protein
MGAVSAVFAPIALAVLASGTTACISAGQRTMGMFDGTTNDPGNRGIRKAVMDVGMADFCSQVLGRSVPLALTQGAPAVGRFYPEQCVARHDDNGLTFSFGGRGYAWTNLSKKVSFASSGTVRYAYDFLMSDSTMYAYFRPREVPRRDFAVRVIEQPMASLLNTFTPAADQFGQSLMDGKMREGFTVLVEPNGAVDFGFGVVELGQRPVHPFNLPSDGGTVYEHQRIEIHQEERDFVGPIVIHDDGASIEVTAAIDGSPQAEFFVMRAGEGRASLDLYLNFPQSGPLAGNPIFGDVLNQGMVYKRRIPVAKGSYYVVFDNTSSAGMTSPRGGQGVESTAVVSYALRLGDH